MQYGIVSTPLNLLLKLGERLGIIHSKISIYGKSRLPVSAAFCGVKIVQGAPTIWAANTVIWIKEKKLNSFNATGQ